MEAYSGFAEVYDTFMDNIPYEEWTEYLAGLLKEYGVENGLVAELGCGTGNITELLADRGYDMIGIDNSEEMLAIAREKQMERRMQADDWDENEDEVRDADEDAEVGETEFDVDCNEEAEAETESGADRDEADVETGAAEILYLLQDMREFELYGTVDAVVSICDSMNYIVKDEDLKQVFSLVNNYLEEHGLFIFDMNTVYKYREVLAQNTIAENRDECSFIWDNYYDEETGINQYDLTLYVQEEEDLFRRFDETHYQRAYELETVKRLLAEAGMEFVTAYDAFTRKPVKEDSERIYVVAREGHQEGKTYQR